MHTSASPDRIHHADMMISDALNKKLFSNCNSKKEYTYRKLLLPVINNYNLLDWHKIQFPIVPLIKNCTSPQYPLGSLPGRRFKRR